MSTQDKILSQKARQLLKEYEDVLLHCSDEIKKEINIPINSETTEAIALEYVRREGIKQGITLLMQKINSKANVID